MPSGADGTSLALAPESPAGRDGWYQAPGEAARPRKGETTPWLSQRSDWAVTSPLDPCDPYLLPPLATSQDHSQHLLDRNVTCCIHSGSWGAWDRDRHPHFADRDTEAGERVRWEERTLTPASRPQSSPPRSLLGSGVVSESKVISSSCFCFLRINEPPVMPVVVRYFSALARGDPLPVKDRIEMPVATQKTDTGLTQGLLKVLHKQV